MRPPEAPRPQAPRPEPSPAAPKGPTDSPQSQASERTANAGVSAPPTDGGAHTGYSAPRSETHEEHSSSAWKDAASSARAFVGSLVTPVKEAATAIKNDLFPKEETKEVVGLARPLGELHDAALNRKDPDPEDVLAHQVKIERPGALHHDEITESSDGKQNPHVYLEDPSRRWHESIN